jgi:hypothetical protein
MYAHPLDQAVFGAVLPEDINWARSGEYVTQITAFGPISLEYLDPADDPRNP